MAARKPGGGRISWRIEVDPDPSVIEKAYGNLARKLVDWRPALQRLIPVIASGTRAVFNTKGGALGEPWFPLTPAYARRKAKRGGRAMLFVSGALRAELTSRAGVLGLNKKRLTFGTDLPYARSIHFGQRRRLLGWTGDMQARASQIMSEHAKRLLEEASTRIAAAGGK